MNPDELCTSDQWSVLSSAASYSQLAGVLGGFLITAIALLFDRNSREGVHTLALFSSAVLILMLDSFLFSVITGSAPPDADRRPACAIAWTQGALSTGMLAAGATALFGGLGWMLATHAVNKVTDLDAADVRAYSFLADLGGWLTFAAAMTTTLIVAETSIDYLQFMLARMPHWWVVALINTTAAAAILVNLALVYLRTKALRTSLVDAAEPTVLALRSLKIATVCTVVLAIVASWLAITLNRIPDQWLTAPSTGLVVIVVVLTFVLPTVVSIAICNFGGQHRESRSLGAGQVSQRQHVALNTESDDHPGGHGAQIRVVPKVLAGVHIRDVHLDQRRAQFGAGIPQGDRGVGERARVEDDGVARVRGGMYPPQQIRLVVALSHHGFQPQRAGLALDQRDQLVVCGAAVDLGFAASEPPQIRAVEHQDRLRHEGTVAISEYAAASSDGSGPSSRPGLPRPSSTTKRSTPARVFLSPAMFSSNSPNASAS